MLPFFGGGSCFHLVNTWVSLWWKFILLKSSNYIKSKSFEHLHLQHLADALILAWLMEMLCSLYKKKTYPRPHTHTSGSKNTIKLKSCCCFFFFKWKLVLTTPTQLSMIASEIIQIMSWLMSYIYIISPKHWL